MRGFDRGAGHIRGGGGGHEPAAVAVGGGAAAGGAAPGHPHHLLLLQRRRQGLLGTLAFVPRLVSTTFLFAYWLW